jgi:hypothetical protein
MWKSLAAVVCVAALAGCSDGGPPAADGPAGTTVAAVGLIEGVVVTPAITPLPGAAVRLEPGGREAATDGSGAFRFEGLEPGGYTVEASLGGYLPQTVAAETGQGLVQIVLAPDIASLAFAQTYVHDGFIESSFNVAGARSSNSDAPNYTFEGRLPDFVQVELVWEATQALGGRMDLTLIADDGGTVLPVAARGEGVSPLVVAMDSAILAEFGFGPDVDLDIAVFVGQEPMAGDSGAGASLQQRFTLFTHMFYGYLPPAGWSFTADGEAPPPTE